MRRYQNLLKRNPALYQAWTEFRGREQSLSPDETLYGLVWLPALTEYVEWVLQSAARRGIRRLYFLARDAWPMYQAAQMLCSARGWKIDCRYLKVSRYGLRVPEYHLLGGDCVERICTGGIRVTFEKIMRRAGLEAEETAAVARAVGFEGQLQRELLYPEILALKPVLAGCEVFLRAVERHSAAAYPAAIGYLEQEGLLDEVPCALVDSGWVGTLQETMERLLRTRRPNLRLEGFYFGLYELPRTVDRAQYHSFYFGPESGLGRKVRFSNCLFETVFSSPDGMTLGYRETGQGFEPVESDRPNQNTVRLKEYGALLTAFLECYCGIPSPKESRRACPGLLGLHMGSPQQWEVAAFGDNLFCDDVLEGTLQEVAAHLSGEEIKCLRFSRKLLLFLGVKKGEVHESAWIEGSIVRNGRYIRKNLFHARTYKYVIYLRKLWKNRQNHRKNSTSLSYKS